MSFRTRLGLLGENGPYAALWGARTVSTLGNWVTLTALLLYLESTGATGLQVGILLAARELPHLLGPVTGALADRLDPRKVMIGCDLTNSALIGAILLFIPSYPVLVTLVALSAVTTALFMPSGKSAVPKLVHPRALTQANALLGSATNLSYAIGPLVGAILFATLGLRAALLLDVATFLISTALLLCLPGLSNDSRFSGDATSSFLSEVRAGISFVASHEVARAVALGMFLMVLFAGIDNVAIVFLLRDTLSGPEISVGVALTFYALAMILAPLLALRSRMIQDRPAFLLLFGMVLNAAGLLLTGLSPVLVAAIAAFAVAGAGNGLENVGVDTLIGRSVPSDRLGRTFGVVYGPIFIAGGAAALVGGWLVDLISPPGAFIVAGIGVGLAAALVWLILPREEYNLTP